MLRAGGTESVCTMLHQGKDYALKIIQTWLLLEANFVQIFNVEIVFVDSLRVNLDVLLVPPFDHKVCRSHTTP